jgi:hypothetical protein
VDEAGQFDFRRGIVSLKQMFLLGMSDDRAEHVLDMLHGLR